MRMCSESEFQITGAAKENKRLPLASRRISRNVSIDPIEEAIEVCGETREMRRYKESWWWNEEIAALVKEKQSYSSC